MRPVADPERLARLVRAYQLAEHEKGRLIREQAGITLQELAARIGTNISELSRWERRKARPRAACALRWLEAIEVIQSARGNLLAEKPVA
jgi:transcriptional regulator with XRE-family HTH domain